MEKKEVKEHNHSVTLQSRSSKPVDFNKEWKNGHKTFNSAESRALAELLHTEEAMRDRYSKSRAELKKPRNPLMGEPTPRDVRGNVVMNPKRFNTISDGVSLFTAEQLKDEYKGTFPTAGRFVNRVPMGKIGVPDERYTILGNTEVPGSPAQSEDYFRTVRRNYDEKAKMKDEQSKVNEYIAREKAKRYQQQLARQLLVLKKEMDGKADEIQFLKQKYSL